MWNLKIDFGTIFWGILTLHPHNSKPSLPTTGTFRYAESHMDSLPHEGQLNFECRSITDKIFNVHICIILLKLIIHVWITDTTMWGCVCVWGWQPEVYLDSIHHSRSDVSSYYGNISKLFTWLTVLKSIYQIFIFVYVAWENFGTVDDLRLVETNCKKMAQFLVIWSWVIQMHTISYV